MELDDYQTLRLIQQRITEKVHSFNTWEEFITWAKGMTQAKFKTFILACLDDIIGSSDLEKKDLLEIKSLIEG